MEMLKEEVSALLTPKLNVYDTHNYTIAIFFAEIVVDDCL